MDNILEYTMEELDNAIYLFLPTMREVKSPRPELLKQVAIVCFMNPGTLMMKNATNICRSALHDLNTHGQFIFKN